MTIHLPIEDILDLHTFKPKEIQSLLDDYFHECLKHHIGQVRVIHGKGKGIIRQMVINVLKKHPLVISYANAPAHAGGWGATIVKLKESKQQ